MSVKVVIGLGNMQAKYMGTLHNYGMEAVARLAKAYGCEFARNKFCAAYLAKAELEGVRVVFAAAEGFMNESGVNLNNILRFLKLTIADTIVIYDEINLESGVMKISLGGSSGGHNGVENILKICGDGFVRFRLGLGQKPYKTMNLADYVLSKATAQQLADFDRLMPKVKMALELTLKQGAARAQNVINARAQNF